MNWEKYETQVIIALSLFAIFFIFSSSDLICIYLSLEFYSFSSFFLVILKYNNLVSNLSLIYFLVNVIGSLLILFSILLLFSNYSVLNLLDLPFIYDNKYPLFLFILGLLIKLGSAPFHFWVISLYDSISTIISLYLSIIPKLIYSLLLVYLLYFIPNDFLSFFAILSLILGSILGLNQNKFKKLLAASSIYNLGLILTVIISNSNNVLPILFLYLINVLNLFSFLLMFNNLDYLNQIKSFFKFNPTISFFLLISSFSLVGIPPFAGFWYKLLIFKDTLLSGNILLLIFALVSTSISAIFYLYIIKYLYSNSYNISTYNLFIGSYNLSLIFSLTSIILFNFYFLLPYYMYIFNLYIV